MKQIRWYYSIRYYLPIIIVVVTIIPLYLVLQYNYSILKQNVINNSSSTLLSNLKNTSLNIENTISDIEQFTNTTVSSNEFSTHLNDYLSATGREKEIARSELTLLLDQNQKQNNNIESIYVIVEGSDTMITDIFQYKEISVHSGDAEKIYNWYLEKGKNQILWYYSTSRIGGAANSLSYIRKLNTLSGLPNCSLIINIKSAYFSGILTNNDLRSGDIIISDSDGNTLIHSDNISIDANIRYNGQFSRAFVSAAASDSYVNKSASKEDLVVYYRSGLKFWKYFSVIPMDLVYGELANQRQTMIIFLLTGIFVAFLGAAIVSKSVVIPVNKLVKAMKSAEEGAMDPVGNINMKNEIGLLIYGYNTMVINIKTLIEQVYIQEIVKKEEQLRSIQAQIDEHFLYNTLNSIIYIAKNEGAQETVDLIYMLSRYFRLHLSEGKSVVTVNEISDMIKAYLWIQKIRFGSRIKSVVRIQPEILDKQVLKYLFQPIVENAVLHGLENKLGEITVEIVLEERDGLLYFEVADNGVGINQDKLNDLLDAIQIYDKVQGKNYALKNINEQIKLTYGKEYGISISSKENIGTKVSFYIPFKDFPTEVKDE